MKKFIVYLLVIILTVSLGFAVFYLVRDNEVISISSASMYKDVGDTFTLDINHINKKASTNITISSSDDSIVSGKYNENNGTYTAQAKRGGVARINVRTTNAKFRNLWCDVIVGDGTVESPFYISTAEQLAAIGMGAQKTITDEDGNTTAVDGVFLGAGKYERYTSDACYKLISNIDASEVNQGFWVPLRNFNGRLDGNGLTISNVYIDAEGYRTALGNDADSLFSSNKPAGLFTQIGEKGIVYNLKLVNFVAEGTYSQFGTIAAINKGLVERIEVKDAYASVSSGVFGGIVGTNTTTETLVEKVDEEGNSVADYVRNIARVDRCSVMLTLGQQINDDGSLSVRGATGTIGGIVGINNGGTVVYSFVRGNVYFGDDSESYITYGGVAGKNIVVSGLHYDSTYDDESEFQGANIKDCYSDLRATFMATPNTNSRIAGAIAINEDSKNGTFDETDNRVNNYLIGIYYNIDNLNYEQTGVTKEFTGVAEFTLDGSKVSFSDTKTIVWGLSAEEMLNADNFVSHTTKTVEFNEDGTSKGIVEKNVLWLFETVWVKDLDNKINDGMPYLNYQLVYIPDDFGTVGVPVVPQDLSAYYYKIEIDYPVSILSGVDGNLRIKVNEYYQLVYSPTGIELTWSTSCDNYDAEDKIISIDENGKIKGLKPGVVTVTAKTKTGSTDSITVIVENIPYEITNLPETIYMYVGDTYDLSEIEINPAPSGNDSVSFKLETEDGKMTDIASISGNNLNANKTGKAILYVSIADTKVAANVVISTRPEVTLAASPRTVSGYIEEMNKTGEIIITNSTGVDLNYKYKFVSGAGIVNLAFDSANKSKLKYEIVGTGNAVVEISITNTGYFGKIEIYFNIKSETSVDLTLSSATITGYYNDIKKTGSVTITNSANATLSYKATSNNTSVVSVSMSGNSMNYTINGIGSATVTIEVTTAHYAGAAYVNFQILKNPDVGEGGSQGSVEFVELNYSSFTLYVGDTLTLKATGTYTSLTWKSSNSSVASVNEGVVTAKKAGSATITATTGSGAKTQCLVTVKNVSTTASISVSPSSATICQGSTKQLTASGSGYSRVTWGSSNSNIASINDSGLVTASSSNTGTVTITAYAKDNNGNVKATDTTSITVVELPTTITLSVSPSTVVNVGTNVIITANVNKAVNVNWNSTTSDSYEKTNGNTLTISTSGMSVGLYTVTASYGTSSAQASFTVQDPNAYPTNGYIYTLAQLNAIRYHLDKDFILAADINVGNWVPIGSKSAPFTGTLKNLGTYKLKGITVDNGYGYAGLFGYISGSGTSVKGIIIDDVESEIIGTTYSGGIAGYAASSATISDCKVNKITIKTTSSTGYAGGIVGRADGASVVSCKASATISATGGGYAGGMVGYSNSNVSMCVVNSTVTAPTSSGSYAGGAVGYTTYKVYGCTIKNSTITAYYAGGVAGVLNRGDSITLKFSEHKKGFRFTDLDSTSQANIRNASISVQRTAVKDSVTVKGIVVGGLFGHLKSGLVEHCYTRATLNGVSGALYKGGFAGSIEASGSFTNNGGSGQVGIILYCYTATKFSGNGTNFATTSALIHNHASSNKTSRAFGYIMQYVFDNDVNGNADYTFGNTVLGFGTDHVQASKSTSSMKNKSTYEDKGFDTTLWNFGSGYPTLKTEQ